MLPLPRNVQIWVELPMPPSSAPNAMDEPLAILVMNPPVTRADHPSRIGVEASGATPAAVSAAASSPLNLRDRRRGRSQIAVGIAAINAGDGVGAECQR